MPMRPTIRLTAWCLAMFVASAAPAIAQTAKVRYESALARDPEVRTLLAKVLERVDTIELDGEPAWSGAHFVSGVKHLPIRYTLR